LLSLNEKSAPFILTARSFRYGITCLVKKRDSCSSSLWRFVGGFVAGSALTVFFWQQVYPPGGPNYGDGIGYGMAMLFVAFLVGLVCGLCLCFIGIKNE
jgi:hypothetical protein